MGMSEQLVEALGRVAERTFEELAFLFSVPGEQEEMSADPDSTAASIRFSGASRGRLILLLSNRVLPELARNMLGMKDDEPLQIDQQEDALRELLNIICGNLLPEAAGPKAVFDLQVPALLDEAGLAEAREAGPASATVCLSLDEGTAELRLFWQDESAGDPTGGT